MLGRSTGQGKGSSSGSGGRGAATASSRSAATASATQRMRSVLCPGGHVASDDSYNEVDIEAGTVGLGLGADFGDVADFVVHEERGDCSSKESSGKDKDKDKQKENGKEKEKEQAGGIGLTDEAKKPSRTNSKGSTKSEGEQVRQVDSQETRESGETNRTFHSLPPGRMRVRILGAQNLPTMSQFFQWPSADCYAVLVLEDTTNSKQSPQHRTRVCHNSLHPRWSEDFWFALSKNAGNINLHVEVWHCIDSQAAKGHDDILLGQCDIKVNEYLQEKEGVAIPLPEQLLIPPAAPAGEEKPAAEVPSFFRQSKKGPSLLLELAWEPTLDSAGLMGNRALAARLLRSAQAMRIARVVLLGGSGALLIVCVNGRWLCRGQHWGDCEQIKVAGTGACSVMAAMAIITVTFIHFFGSSGLFGNDWTGVPVGWMDLLVSELELREGDKFEGMGQSTMRMQINHDTLARFNVHVATNILPPVSHYMLRVMSLCAYLVTYLLCGMSAFLTLIQSGEGKLLGEAFFINFLALVGLTLGWMTSCRESSVLLLEDRERWRVVDELGQATRGHLSERMYSQGSPQYILEEIARRGVENLTSLQQQAENFTQPLKDAWQPFQQRLGLDVGAKRVAKSLDGLLGSTGSTTSLNQPLLDRHGGATSPNRRAGFPCRTTPTTPLSNRAGSGHELEAVYPDMAGVLVRNTSRGFAEEDEEMNFTPQSRGPRRAEPKGGCCGC